MRRLFLALFFLLNMVTVIQAQEPEIDLARIRRATVFLMQVETTESVPIITCVGTGTLVSRDGLIVTNAHHTMPNPDCPGEQVIVALSIRDGEPPVPTYYADVVQANTGLDLAILRITQDVNRRLVESSTLSLPFVELGDSSQVTLDDTVTVVGYPGVGDEDAATDIIGTVTGFVAEPSGGERAWIKTDAAIPGAMTGGGVYNEQGQLIAVPTSVPVAPLVADVTCPLLQDTNSDGVVNRADACVPLGTAINALRPSRFVRLLFRAASLGLQVEKVSEGDINALSPAQGQAQFSNLIFSPSVVNGMPTVAAPSLPTGTTSLYLFFDYANMTPDTIYELRVTVNNRPSQTFSLAPVRWSGGQNGLWYIGSSGQVWPNGVYDFTLYINGIASGTQTINIGAVGGNPPSFSNISFGFLDESSQQLFGLSNVLPAAGVVTAQFIHRNMTDGLPWQALWYYKGQLARRDEFVWENDPTNAPNVYDLSVSNAGAPLEPGSYRLVLYVDGRLSTLSDFTIAGAADGAFPRVFDNVRFVNTADERDMPTAPRVTTYTADPAAIYVVFDWELLEPGTLWTMRWSVDGTAFYEETVPWANVRTGTGYVTRLSAPEGLPDGTYRVEMLINNTVLAEVEARVGIGQLPIDPFADATGVQMVGRVVDAETQAGIPGVALILLTEDYSVEDWIWDQSQVYAITVTDRNGNFQFDRLLGYEVPYSIIINAEGYLPMNADGVEVDAESDNPLDVLVVLTRD